MAVTMKGRDFISIDDFSPEELYDFIRTAEFLKLLHNTGQEYKPLRGKSLGMIFSKPSTRTRVSFEVAIYQLGGHGIYLNPGEMQLGRGETIADTAKVLSRFLDGILIRTFNHDDVIELAENSSVPVINGLTDLLHPTQTLADLITIKEKKGALAGIKIAYLGDGNNVAHSLMFAASKLGMKLSIASPSGFEPQPAIVKVARKAAAASGGAVEVVARPEDALVGADVIYTDVWASMGQESEREPRLKALRPYQVNEEAMALAKPDAIFMHCLPAHRGEEVTEEVIDGPQSVVFDQAENRLHAHKAILALLI